MQTHANFCITTCDYVTSTVKVRDSLLQPQVEGCQKTTAYQVGHLYNNRNNTK